jgi:hypothetical protein
MEAPDFTICVGTIVDNQLFLNKGARCAENYTMSVSHNINNQVPGNYSYTITCTRDGYPPAQTTGTVTVVSACTVTAPDFSIHLGTTVNNQLFMSKGAGCPVSCTMQISHNINNMVPGTYSYTVTCNNGFCPPAQATGTVTVLAPCTAEAPDFTICVGTTVDHQLFLDNGANCSQSCTVNISHNVNSMVPGTYSYTVHCGEQCSGAMDTGEVTVVPCITEYCAEIDLEKGWNLISFPCYIEPEYRHPSMQFSGIMDSLSIAYAYDGCIEPAANRWSTYMPLGPGTLTETRDGWGYWLLMDAPDILGVAGTLEAPEPPPSYSLCVGWNLIGVRSSVPVLASEYLATIDGKYKVIYGYHNGSYFSVSADDELIPGQGYWIAMLQEGTIQY